MRLPGLDVIRAGAVLLVIGYHLPPPPPDWWAAPLVTVWQRGGWVGVDLFFVLSGFLVSGLLFQDYQVTGQIAPRQFYIRRWWKIYPPLVYLSLVSWLVASTIAMPDRWARLGAELFFVQNVWSGFWLHTWSLAVEEHFYLLLPLVLGWVTPARVVPVAVSVWVLCLTGRLLNAALLDFTPATHVYPTYLRFDGLWAGVALSYLYHFHRDQVLRWAPWRRHVLVCGGIFLVPVCLVPLEAPLMHTLGFTVSALAGVCLVVGALLTPVPSWLRPLATIGAASYSIYLWHMPVLEWGLRSLPTEVPYGVRVLLAIGGSIALGGVMARAVEVPALAIRDRWWPSARQSHPTGPATPRVPAPARSAE